ncbi:16S rRNA (cytidine1402-2'-O)-methyltransferase [Roseivirga pacifica]|uniref:16S rRNA (Cytidine1402-2'-O)-methyltransferase n=1 Tax=Roseivirga pacifica TaxID=1267423 RepID=A0A1I0N3W8_9BACT|nr:SAM-dependent methyltransferase [Roseivirga pacifica]RKQ50897.1 16S rRNA (cytidine1402-2'-O)-methyltransferase [Roseivirga pacifica]SEV95515.1 16S rRNA (cytidine1402-2'-O)-methyltransferase [Roseivirga pacifica]
MNNPGQVFLIPNVIAEGTQEAVIPQHVKSAILACDFFLVENLRTARRYISSLKLGLTIEELEFQILDKKTSYEDCFELLQPVLNGKNVGIISESGCPGVADPGARLVHMAHQFRVKVNPLVGPSSILLALMASGFNGQSFAFHGYLPIDKKDRQLAIRNLEKSSKELNQTQIFMDTPYRNEQLLADVIKTCRKDTYLCVARDISGKEELILSKPVEKWKANEVKLKKIPTIFIIYST